MPNKHETGYRDKFCRECASPVAEVEVMIRENPPSYFPLKEGPRDRDGHVYLLGEDSIDEYNDDEYELTPRYVSKELKSAEETYADHIEALRMMYDTVEIRFGLVVQDVRGDY